MQLENQVLECNFFEVILHIKNRAMLFSTCVYSSYSEDALDIAEKEFSIHTARHKLGAIKADAAFVIDRPRIAITRGRTADGASKAIASGRFRPRMSGCIFQGPNLEEALAAGADSYAGRHEAIGRPVRPTDKAYWKIFDYLKDYLRQVRTR